MALSFIFDTSKGETPESVARKRALVAQIMGIGPVVSPRNTWDGVGNAFASIAGGIAARNLNKQADAATQAGQDSAASAWNPLLASMGGQQFPVAPGSDDSASAADIPSQRVAQAFGDNAASQGGGDVEGYIRQAAAARGIDPDIAVRVARSEGGLKNPYRHGEGPAPRSQLASFGAKEHSFGPFQLYISGNGAGLGDRALAAGIDPRKNWKGGIDYALDEVSKKGWGQWYGARGQGITGMMGVGRRPASVAANEAMATGQSVPSAPIQIASLDPSAGLPDIAPIPTPSPGPANVMMGAGKGDRVANVGVVAPDPSSQFIPQAGQTVAGDPKTQRILGTMMNPQPMGGSPMPMQGGPSNATQPPAQPVQVAQAQSPGQDLSRIPVAAGGTSGVYQPGQGPSLQMLMQAASNPWLNESQRGVINMMLKQRMSGGEQNDFQQRASAAAQYGLDPNSAEGRNFILTGKLPEQRGGAAELGLNPQYGLDKDGNPVLLQLGKDGNVVQSKLPDGVHLSKEPIKVDLGTSWGLIDPITRQVIGNVPKDLKGAAEDTEQGKLQAALRQSLPSDMMNTRQALSDIDALINNPGLDSIVGGADQYRPSWLLGDQGRDAAARLNQIKGKTFLQAYATLKGGGAITEVEGKKAEDAIGRLDRAQDEKTFRQALSDLRDVIAEGQNVMLQKAGIPQDQWGQYLNGAAGAGGGQKRLKFNPATGELE